MTKRWTMHAARLETSPPLQRLLAVLRSGAEYTTLDLIDRAHVCAISARVSELRENGFNILCERRGRHWYYRLSEPVQLEWVA